MKWKVSDHEGILHFVDSCYNFELSDSRTGIKKVKQLTSSLLRQSEQRENHRPCVHASMRPCVHALLPTNSPGISTVGKFKGSYRLVGCTGALLHCRMLSFIIPYSQIKSHVK
jgi:hypothetical protein